MKLLSVIPIAKGISKENLSYFTSLPIEEGSIIKVKIRTRLVPALVVSVEEATGARMELKRLPFGIRKIESVEKSNFPSAVFLKSARECADHFATSTGNVLQALLPAGILKDGADFSLEKSAPESSAAPEKNRPPEKFILQADDEERLSIFRSLIREEFARGKSVYICLPTAEDAKRVIIELQKGIEEYSLLLHGSLKPKTLKETWEKISVSTHPLLIVATGTFFSAPIRNLGTIIVERENSRSYKTISRPFLDLRTFAEIFSKNVGTRLIFCDTLLRAETLWRFENKEFLAFRLVMWRSFTTQGEKIVDMRKERDNSGHFEILGTELKEIIRANEKKNGHIFLFATRKGFAPTTICRDCGSTVTCLKCGSPVVLYEKKAPDGKNENFFLCHSCGTKRSAEEMCRNCGGWRLTPVGLGIDRVGEAVKKEFPESPLFILDKEKIKTASAAHALVSKFYETPGGILLGTEMALLYLNKKVNDSGVVSMDSSFSVPDFRINEKIMNILLKIRGSTTGKFIIQTRNPDQSVLSFAREGNLMDFYRQEIEERKQYLYPPFTVFIKISLTGGVELIEREMKKVEELAKPYPTAIFQGLSRKKGANTLNALIKIPREKWPDADIISKLRSLPPYFSIQVDPESLL